MKKREFLAVAAAAAASAVVPASFAAGAYPVKDVKLVIPFAPGGATDVVFRLFAGAAEAKLGKPIVSVNMGGAGGSKGSAFVKGQAADGYVLLGGHEFLMTTYHAGMVQFGLDAFEPVCTLTLTPMFIAAGKHVPYSNLKELLDYVKKNPGKVVLAMTPASIQYVFWRQFAKAAGLDLNKAFRIVMINGNGPQAKAMMGEHADIGFGDFPSYGTFINDGRMKAIGVAYGNRLPQLPKTRTLKEDGIDIPFSCTRAVFAPKGTPKEAIAKLAAAFKEAAKDPAVVKRVEEMGNLVVYEGPEKTREYFWGVDPNYAAALAKPKS